MGRVINKFKAFYYNNVKKSPILYARKMGVRIGDGAEIYKNVNFGSEPYLITIGNHVRINSGVHLITHDGGMWVVRNVSEKLKNVDLFGPIVIGDNVHIGTNAIIMPGVKIGNNCIVGCGAIVTKNVPDNSIVAGVPARIIENIEEYIGKHYEQFDFTKDLSAEEKRTYLERKYDLE